METSRPFIIKPHFFKNDEWVPCLKPDIEYYDILTYVTIRSFNNVKNSLCYPPLEKIAERAGVSKKFIQKSVDRLEAAKYITISKAPPRSRKANHYHFRPLKHFDRIPYELFDCHELSLYEKGMLLCLRELSTTEADIMGDITQLAGWLSMSYKTLYTQMKSLISKGYIEERLKSYHRLINLDWRYPPKDRGDSEMRFIL